ncbi:hypothetical protein [Serratia fonticola]|uniref:hypothetical protein n=1 Tax=Serratia fonticola TaxID=47917 RepID=UPI00192CF38E|nr:hypothetical protein [Serratia fonticola]MBL5826885.1 hypothetical protein [Serratia fonticola]
MKKKLIAVIFIIAILSIITAIFFWLLPAEEKPNLLPIDNTLYVQSSLSGECRAIITPILDGVASTPSEIPCKVQSLSKK